LARRTAPRLGLAHRSLHPNQAAASTCAAAVAARRAARNTRKGMSAAQPQRARAVLWRRSKMRQRAAPAQYLEQVARTFGSWRRD
jgi:hypothetical protein